MFRILAVLLGVFAVQSVFAGVPGSTDVLARYFNNYRGDDDYMVHCLVENTGDVTLIGQGLQTVHVHHQKTNPQLIATLKKQVAAMNANKSDAINYSGYNFLNVGDNAESGIAVLKTNPAEGTGYYKVKMDSQVAETVKKACKIEESVIRN